MTSYHQYLKGDLWSGKARGRQGISPCKLPLNQGGEEVVLFPRPWASRARVAVALAPTVLAAAGLTHAFGSLFVQKRSIYMNPGTPPSTSTSCQIAQLPAAPHATSWGLPF